MNNYIFPTLIYQKQYPGDLKKLQDYVIPNMNPIIDAARENNQVSMRNDAVCSAMLGRNLNDYFDFTELYKFVEDCVKEYWQELNYKSLATFEIANTWINSYPKNGYIDTHNHAPSIISSTFYLKKPKNSGGIIFENPLATLRRYEPFELGDPNASFENKALNHTIDVNEGDLILFPGWMDHRSEPNMSDEDRIVLAFDVLPTF